MDRCARRAVGCTLALGAFSACAGPAVDDRGISDGTELPEPSVAAVADATGFLPCSTTATAYGQQCPMAVLRGDGRAGTLYVTGPTAADRIFDYDGSGFSTPQGSLTATRAGAGTWNLVLDGSEYYQVADAVLVGG